MSGMLGAFLGVMGKIGSVTASANWGAMSGAYDTNVDSASRTMTVPGGNPGSLNLAVAFDLGVGVPQYKIAAGSFTSFSDGQDITVANGETLQFRIPASAGVDGTGTITVTDNTTGATVGTAEVTIVPP
jgi:hypothetical protein